MPRNSSGIYSKPAGTTAVAGNLIDPVAWNNLTTDLGNEITNSLPRDGSAPMTAPLQASPGSSSLPSMTFNTAATTGFYLKSATEIGVVSAATEVASFGPYGVFFGTYETQAVNYTAALADNNAFLRFSATATLAMTAAATLTAKFRMMVYANGGTVTIDPNGSETINGALTLTLNDGQVAMIFCTGSAFYAVVSNITVSPWSEKNTGFTAVGTDNGSVVRATAAFTLALTAATTLGSGWRMRIIAYGGDVLVDPNGTETINGFLTIYIRKGQTADIYCNGTAFFAVISGDTLSGPQLQGYSTGLTLATSATNATNAVDISAGAAASDTSPFYLMQLASALGKRVDQSWTVGGTPATPLGGLDTGSVTNATYYIWQIARSDTSVVDTCFSLSNVSPTFGGNIPTAYDRKRLLGSFIRASGVNGTINSALLQYQGLTLSALIATTSGTIALFAIPAGVRRVHLFGKQVSTTGTVSPVAQIGPAAGLVGGANYIGSVMGNTSPVLTTSFVGVPWWSASITAASSFGFAVTTFEHMGSNLWSFKLSVGLDSAAGCAVAGGFVQLADVLTQVALVLPSTAFDAGTVWAGWEY